MSPRQNSLEQLLANQPSPETRPYEVRAAAAEESELDTLGSCRFARRPQMMLAFRKSSGEFEVFAYSMLCRIRSEDPARSFELRFAATTVTVTGENMMRLFEYVCEHRMLRIVESDRVAAFANNSASVPSVHRIEFLGAT